MADLKLFVLGQPRLERDGAPIELNLRKALALLVYVVVSGRSHSRDGLATLLWPESDAREGRARLRRTLHRLNEAIGEHILVSTAETIGVSTQADVWLDSAAFRQHATAGLAAATADALAPQRLAQLSAALELYEDDFLGGFTLPASSAFDEWQFFERESLRQLYGQVLEQLVQAERSRQGWEAAIGYARRWLALDELHEPAHRMLMRLYGWAGQQAAALRQYQECVRVLEAELGVVPEDETSALYQAIRSRQFSMPETAERLPDAPLLASELQPHLRYVVEQSLAIGGQGEVFRARDTATDQLVAIKWLKTELADQHPDLVARFVREGTALRRLNHPNIVGILDTFEHDGRYAIVMEYVPGGSLRTLLDQAHPLPLEQVLMFGLELADALSRAHHLGIIHRDLKPENVLLAADGTLRLTDFGLAHLDGEDVLLTQSGTFIGSPAYMSPEAVRGEEVDARSDIWALGVLLYELLAGRRPFEGTHVTPLLASILEHPVPDLRQFRPDAPPALVDLLGRMLLKQRAQRLSSMRQVAAKLEAIRAGRGSDTMLFEQPGQNFAGVAPLVADLPPRAGRAAAHLYAADAQAATIVLDDAPPDTAEGLLFVARDQELGRLHVLLGAALAAQSQVAFVVGEAGQGKTELLQAFARRAEQAHSDLIVAWGNCNAYTGAGDPYLPFREILELLTGDVEARALAGRLRPDRANRLWHTLPATAQALLDAGPDLLDTFISARRLLSRAAAYGAGGAAWLTELQALAENKAATSINPQQNDLFEQYARVVRNLARRAPLLLIVDDLQWADSGSIDLLLHLGRRLKGSRVLLVGAYRPADVAIGRDGLRHPLERALNELQRDFGEIVLDLSCGEGRLWVDALLDAEPNQLDEAFRAALYRQTAGHPLFTIELLRDLQERGELVRDAAGRWVAAPELHWNHLPARVEGAIGERIGRLDAQLRELLQAASVEGEEFTAEVVARVLGTDEQVIVRRLSRELDQTHHLVRALGVRRDDGVRLSRYRFRHILIQRYLYSGLDAVERSYQHEAVGQALEQLYGPRVAEIAAQLAWHFAAAQLSTKASFYNEQAGDQARRSAALELAVDFYQAVLEAWPQSDLRGRAQLLRKLGECQWMCGHLQDALAPFEECHMLYASLGDAEGAGAVQRLLGRLYWEMGDRERLSQHYYQALALLEQRPESVELAWAISSIAQMHMVYSENDQAISWGQRALDMAERLGADQVVVQALNDTGTAYFANGDAKRGEAMLRRSWQRAVELNLPHDASRAACNLGVCLTDFGLTAEARAVIEELRAYVVRMRIPFQIPLFAGLALIALAELDWLTGRWQSALARCEEIRVWVGRGQSISFLEVNANVLFAWMRNDLGQPELARELLQHVQSKVTSRAEIQTTGPYLGQYVRALGMCGFGDAANQAAWQFLTLIEQHHDYLDNTVSQLAVCRWFASRAANTRAELNTSLAQLELAHAQLGSIVSAAGLSEGRGLLALSEGDAPGAVAHLRQAAAHWQALDRPYDWAYALTRLGQALVLAGDDGEAHSAFDQALSVVERLAAQLEDAELRAAFLRSPLAHDLDRARAALATGPVPTDRAYRRVRRT